MRGPTQNLGSIGSAVLAFIGYKQIDRHPDKQSIYTRLLGRYALIFYLWTCSFCKHCNTNKISRILWINSWIFKIFKNRILIEANFRKFHHPSIIPGVTRDPTTYSGPIGSAVLTFIGYKQTNTKTPWKAKYIYK